MNDAISLFFILVVLFPAVLGVIATASVVVLIIISLVK